MLLSILVWKESFLGTKTAWYFVRIAYGQTILMQDQELQAPKMKKENLQKFAVCYSCEWHFKV